MKYTVIGSTRVTVSMDVEANSAAEAIEKANNEFGGIIAYVGNGGCDKLIGVAGETETIASYDCVIFDDTLEDDEQDEHG